MLKNIQLIVMKDEQSLQLNPRGITGVAGEISTYKRSGVTQYEVIPVENHDGDQQLNLFIIRKYCGDLFDTYVCYTPNGIENGSKDNFEFLFSGKNYEDLFCCDGFDFTKTLSVTDLSTSKNPVFVTEYTSGDNCINNRVFVVETMNMDTRESFVEFYMGCLVRNEEIDVC